MLSVSELGREMVRLRVCWKARRFCLRFAVRSADGLARMVLAWERSWVRILSGFLGEGGSGDGMALGVGISSESSSFSLEESFER